MPSCNMSDKTFHITFISCLYLCTKYTDLFLGKTKKISLVTDSSQKCAGLLKFFLKSVLPRRRQKHLVMVHCILCKYIEKITSL